MMRLTRRIAAVEKKLGVGGPCPVCGGKGGFALALEGEDIAATRHCCERCGAAGMVMVLVEVGGEGISGDAGA